ncbi:hypothetical protein TBLA_0A00730 [Henningerozyma blattae CBS 6284]|uniref:Zn(2)-C6 fungal-type domain-containing protein n=1 Tax=Henningerozyma blattae (strain ATCC 34711 / CBS 6284 / DSM 70876 / NBRC 10599 / NRRL Y-10934 / UCD 77-7) TaxID=1071380 RepID=I2GUS2_HENB6|nr:hypothetical protein TBLA_0A00730 [Tetrapisispora blattae CBS 6284]CCH57874.1 hypothetical protein TBLA_0A00730 [Tetrapisispora blattae CBS 6284]
MPKSQSHSLEDQTIALVKKSFESPVLKPDCINGLEVQEIPAIIGNSQQLGKKRKITRACIRCRERHIKCPGNDPCQKCLEANHICKFSEPNKKVIVSINYLTKLHDNIKTLEDENSSLKLEVNKLKNKLITSKSKILNANKNDITSNLSTEFIQLPKISFFDTSTTTRIPPTTSNNYDDFPSVAKNNINNSNIIENFNNNTYTSSSNALKYSKSTTNVLPSLSYSPSATRSPTCLKFNTSSHFEDSLIQARNVIDPISSLSDSKYSDKNISRNNLPPGHQERSSTITTPNNTLAVPTGASNSAINITNYNNSNKLHITNTQESSGNDEQIGSNFAQRSGRLVESSTGQHYFVGSSSMTLFGLEIQSLVTKYLKKRDDNVKNKKLSTSDKHNTISINTLTSNDEKLLPNDTKSNDIIHDTIEYLQNKNVKQISNVPTLDPVNEVFHEEGNAYKIILSSNENDDDLAMNFKFPSYSYAINLVDAFLAFNGGCFYFFNEGLVRYGLKKIYNNENFYEDHTLQTIWLCKLLLIFAIGEMYLGPAKNIPTKKAQSPDIAKLPGSGFFEEGSRLFGVLFSNGRVENVTLDGGIEVTLLYAFYLQVADCTATSYFFLGEALRACLLLGMHVDAQSDTLSRCEVEHRRRLWWTVYMFERMLSSKAGLPLSFTDNTISTELPSNINCAQDNDILAKYYYYVEAAYIGESVKIVQINGQILSKLYQRQPSSNILPILKDILKQLLNWKSNVPESLQVDFNDPCFKISRTCTNLYTEYFQGINLSVRPLLFHFVTLQLREYDQSKRFLNLHGYSSTIISLLNSSLHASINSIKTLWSLAEQQMLALFGYMDREYLFTASSTLVLFNTAFGVHEQTSEYLDQALTMFSRMSNLGNHPAGLRMAQLITLMVNLDFYGVMKALILKHNPANIDTHSDKYSTSDNIDTKLNTDSVSQQKGNSSSADINYEHTNDTLQPMNFKVDEQSTLFDPFNDIDDNDIQQLLETLDKADYSDTIWKEISDQAMWLGNTMDPTGAAGTELDFGDIHPYRL